MMKFLSLIILMLAQTAFSALPEYNAPLILARANINDGYNIPAMSFLSNTNPVINNRGDVSFRIMAVEGQNDQAIWSKTFEDENGKIVYVAPEQRFITDPSINDHGKIVFNLHDEGVTDGLFILDTKDLEVKQVLSPDNLPIKFYTYPQIKNNDQIYFRATDDFDDRIFYEFKEEKLNKIMSEGVESMGLKSAYLFRPSFNDSEAVAFKARLGDKGQWDEERPDQILIFTGGQLTAIAKDRDSDPKSPFLRFGNTVSLSSTGMVAFTVKLEDGKGAIVISKDNVLKVIAFEGQNDITEIETFAPKINAQGQVAFRAIDINGKRGIYLADETGVKRIVGEGDEIMTDLGMGRILSNPNYPGFGGDVDMNDHGEIVFYCVIVDSDERELGSAVYKITPKI
ncbi:MAG: choice-of-anchor tandem repeat NxxGxxAF-containing protein [Bacteriovorax sp.]|jgi:hypothetical protein